MSVGGMHWSLCHSQESRVSQKELLLFPFEMCCSHTQSPRPCSEMCENPLTIRKRRLFSKKAGPATLSKPVDCV